MEEVEEDRKRREKAGHFAFPISLYEYHFFRGGGGGQRGAGLTLELDFFTSFRK